MLSLCYIEGTGVEENPSKAFALLKPVADLGHPQAQYALAVGYKYGEWGTKDPKEAFTWYKKSAEQGRADAQLCVGKCYADGYGVIKDLKEAASWYQKAADQGNEEAKTRLKELNQKGLTEELVRSLVKKYNLAQYLLTQYLLKGSDEFNKRIKKAIKAYAASAEYEEVLLMQDKTVLGSAKEGFVLTTKTLYFKVIREYKGQVPLSKIASVVNVHSGINYYLFLKIKQEKTEKEYKPVFFDYSSDRDTAERKEKFWTELLEHV